MNIFEAYNSTKKALEKAGIEDYVFEAKQIIKHITGFSSSEILMNYTSKLTEFQSNNLTAIIRQRELRYPLQYIFGVLVPRADTETVIEVCLDFLKDKKDPKILDLCAGSGCIGITLAKEKPEGTCLMVEKFAEAKRYAEKNIERNKADNAEIISGDVFEGTASGGKYDVIVSNPPYIPENEMKTVSPETKYEPETALKGGADGLKFYRAITENYKRSLESNGMLVFEVGIGEAEAVKEILKNAGLKKTGSKKDLNGIERVVYAFSE